VKLTNNYVSGDSTPQNHGYHDAKEDNDNNRIDEAEPMYPGIKNMEIVVPSSGLWVIRKTQRMSCPSNVPMVCQIP
jgi:hypothetical protein